MIQQILFVLILLILLGVLAVASFLIGYSRGVENTLDVLDPHRRYDDD